MESIVAVAMVDKKGRKYYFLTWGRVLDIIDDRQLIQCVNKYASRCDVEKPIVAGYLCNDLQEASGQMYFYEHFFNMAERRIAFRKSDKVWNKEIAKKLKEGREVYYLGNPKFLKKYKPIIRRF